MLIDTGAQDAAAQTRAIMGQSRFGLAVDTWRKKMSPEENKGVVRRFLEALDRQDFDALKEHPGLYQTVQRQPMVRAAFPDLRTNIEQQVAEGDTVATRATMEGTHAGTFFGVAPTNKRVKVTLLLIDQIVEGKIVLHYANADWIGVLVQLGALPPPQGMTKTLT
jgi:predicted ester cyclase